MAKSATLPKRQIATGDVPSIARGRTNQFYVDWEPEVADLVATLGPDERAVYEDVDGNTAAKLNRNFAGIVKAKMRDINTDTNTGTLHVQVVR